jgi:hypothetical protein
MGPLHGKKKEHLSLDIHRNASPSLLETLYGFGGNAQELCQLALCFAQMTSNFRKLLFVHSNSPVQFLP